MPNSRSNLRTLHVSASLWNLSSATAGVLVPLYAHHMGFSAAAIGSFFGGVMLLQLVVRLLGGQLSDRLGERTLLVICFSLMAVANATYLWAGLFRAPVALLIVGQTMNVLSRGIFYVSAQSYVSRTGPGLVEARLGRLMAVNHASQLPGFIAAGLLAQLVGFSVSFALASLLAIIAAGTALRLPQLRFESRQRRRGIGSTITSFMSSRATFIGFACALFARVPLSLIESFYPIYFGELGFTEGIIGTITSVITIGPVLAGFVIARFMGPETRPRIFLYSILLLCLALFLSGRWTEGWLLAPLILVLGIGSGVMNILYQVFAADGSPEDQRGMAMAVMGMGFALGGIVVPFIFGFLVESGGYGLAFSAFAGACLVIGFLTLFLFRKRYKRHSDSVPRAVN